MGLLRKFTIASPHGYYREEWDDGRVIEADLLTCVHCQYTWRVIPGSGRKRGWCFRCNGPICGAPVCMSGCRPFEAWLDGTMVRPDGS